MLGGTLGGREKLKFSTTFGDDAGNGDADMSLADSLVGKGFSKNGGKLIMGTT
jgi:hypothetical protein